MVALELGEPEIGATMRGIGAAFDSNDPHANEKGEQLREVLGDSRYRDAYQRGTALPLAEVPTVVAALT